MYKLLIKSILTFIVGSYIFLLCMVQIKIYKFGLLGIFGEVFPAIDVMVVYYFSTYKNVNYLILFLSGFLLDQLYQMPICANAIILIGANMALVYSRKWFLLKEEVTNIIGFCFYSLLVIGARYLMFVVNHRYGFDGSSIYFYSLTTMLSYPLFRIMVCYVRP